MLGMLKSANTYSLINITEFMHCFQTKINPKLLYIVGFFSVWEKSLKSNIWKCTYCFTKDIINFF